MHTPSEDKSEDAKRQFVQGIGAGFFYHFLKYHMKILLGDFNAKVGRESIFRPTAGNESLSGQ
jgi:hypothetical protein